MGSLMAGWSTKPSHADDALKRSASSLTKEEVDKFWRTKRSLMQEHLDEATKDAAISPRGKIGKTIAEESDSPEQMAEEVNSSEQMAAQAEGLSTSLPASPTQAAWWTRSNWAFLNDPPTPEAKQSRYIPQFDAALKGQMAQDHSGRSLPSF